MKKFVFRPTETLWDVVVIGGGPAGSSTARFLAEQGYKVIIIEKDLFPGEKNACGGALSSALYKNLNLPPYVKEVEIYSMSYVSQGKKKVWEYEVSPLISFYRRVFDRELAKGAQEKGAFLLTNTIVKDIDCKNGEVFTKLGTIKGRKIVIADGPLTIGRKCGIGFDIRHQPHYNAIVYEIERTPESPDDACIICRNDNPWGYYWIFPKRERYNVGVGIRREKSYDLVKHLNEFIQEVEFLRGKRVLRRLGGVIPSYIGKNPGRFNCIAVGDAGGFAEAFGGGGILYAIKSGEIAGRAILKSLDTGKNLTSIYKSLLRRSIFYWYMRFSQVFMRFSHLFFRTFEFPSYPLIKRLHFTFLDIVYRVIKKI